MAYLPYAISFYILRILIYIFPPSLPRSILFTLLLGFLLYKICSSGPFANHGDAIQIAGGSAYVMNAFHNLWITKPDTNRNRYRLADEVRSPGYDISKERSIWKKFCWGFDYTFHTRGIGWSHQVSGVPSIASNPSFLTRSSAVRFYVVKILKWYLLMDAINTWRDTQPFYADEGWKEGYGSSWNTDWVGRVVAGVTGMIAFRGMLEISYDLAAVVFIGIGNDDPKLWPPFFGPLTHITTLRSFWSSHWHQMHRDTFLTLSSSLLALLPTHLRRSRIVSAYFTLLTSFILSAIIHVVLVYNLPWPSRPLSKTKNTPWRGGDQWVFFLGQVGGIVLEDTVLAIWNRRPLGPPPRRRVGGKGHERAAEAGEEKGKWMRRVVGWTWLLVWFTVMSGYLNDETVISGLNREVSVIPWSPLGWVRGLIGEWGLGKVEG